MAQRVLLLCTILALFISAVHCLNGIQCLAFVNGSEDDERNGIANGTLHANATLFGRGTDNSGLPVRFNATAIPYQICVNSCPGGHSAEAFNWSTFSKQFTSWLLPYLALISQLPWGAEYRLDNLVSMFLTVGSPMLAAYSLILTVLNGHYVTKRFAHMNYPNKHEAVRILAGLQQSPVRVSNRDGGLLASLVCLPQNDKWWTRMKKMMNYEHTWSIPAVASIGWVIVAYIFTVADSFLDIDGTFHANGQGAGCLWLWLIPVVVGWLQISPKCNHARLAEALAESNEIAYIATADPEVAILASAPYSGPGAMRAFTFLSSSVFSDELCTAPIFNYARFFSWTHCVEEVAEAFYHASARANSKFPVYGEKMWSYEGEVHHIPGLILPQNRRGSLEDVIEYCSPDSYDLWTPRLPDGTLKRFAMASCVALALQLCTGGGAMIVNARTPTTGLGCRTGSYLLYTAASIVIWAIMVSSSVLAYYSTNRTSHLYDPNTSTTSQRVAAQLSVILRRFGKILAAMNAVWIVTICIFQFINFFNRCLCNSSVWSRGVENAFMVVKLLPEDHSSIVAGWSIGVATASVACCLFIGFIQLYHHSPSHDD